MTNQKSIAKIIFSIVVVFSLSTITAEPLRAGTIDQTVDDPLTVFGHGSVDLLDGIAQQPNNDNTNLAWNFGSVATHFTSLGPIDIVLPVDNSGGTTEYLISDLVKNQTSYIWKGFQFQLGFGSGDSFVASNTFDKLDFDLPNKDPLPYADLHVISQYEDSVLEFQGGGASEVPPNHNSLFHFSFDIPDFNSQMPDVSQTSEGYAFTVRQEPIPKNYYALLIGMDYEPTLEYWSQDAVKLSEGLKRFDGWETANYILPDKPTDEDIVNAINQIQEEITPGDEFLFYYYGHSLDTFHPSNIFNPEPSVHLNYYDENNRMPVNEDSVLDEALVTRVVSSNEEWVADDAYSLFDDTLESLLNTDLWNSVDKTFIFNTCFAGGFWASPRENDPILADIIPWDRRDLSNLQQARFLGSSAEDQLTNVPGINPLLIEYLNSHEGNLNYSDWFNYVRNNDPWHKANYRILSNIDYSGLYTFDSKPVFFSTIEADQSWANQYGAVPEPSTAILLMTGLIGTLCFKKKST